MSRSDTDALNVKLSGLLSFSQSSSRHVLVVQDFIFNESRFALVLQNSLILEMRIRVDLAADNDPVFKRSWLFDGALDPEEIAHSSHRSSFVEGTSASHTIMELEMTNTVLFCCMDSRVSWRGNILIFEVATPRPVYRLNLCFDEGLTEELF